MALANCGKPSFGAEPEHVLSRPEEAAAHADAGAASVVCAPAEAAITLAIWMDDGGSPFFEQTRIGAGREPFRILQFRTMCNGALTRVGRWLRRTGLDELPARSRFGLHAAG